MTSAARKQGRRARREAARISKKDKFMKPIDRLSPVADFDNLMYAFKDVRSGVTWKASVQNYDLNLTGNLQKLHNKILNDEKVGSGFNTFSIMERGKVRLIQSVDVEERVAQRALCEHALLPAFRRSLIYDNGASLKYKGISFTIKRLRHHMADYYRKVISKNPNKEVIGYALKLDFKDYFANIIHNKVKCQIDDRFNNASLKNYTYKYVDAFDGDIGLGLGSEVSQIFAVSYANSVDHYIKEVLHVKYYGRYMDDSYLIHEDKSYLQYCLKELQPKFDELGIKLNAKKTKIIPLKDGIPFLKTLFFYGKNGKIIATPARKSIVAQRRKIKKLKNFYTNGTLTLDQIRDSYMSWRGFIAHKNARKSVFSMDKLARRLFGTYFHKNYKNKDVKKNLQKAQNKNNQSKKPKIIHVANQKPWQILQQQQQQLQQQLQTQQQLQIPTP